MRILDPGLALTSLALLLSVPHLNPLRNDPSALYAVVVTDRIEQVKDEVPIAEPEDLPVPYIPDAS